MKSLFKLIFTSTFLIFFIGCHNEPVDLYPSEKITSESGNGPGAGGLSKTCTKIFENAELLPFFELDTNLPATFDLSEFMPPVRSQGQQGSCVAWATGYYLRSYQERIRTGKEYDTFDDVKSPAFVYNLAKESGDCSAATCIVNALYVLKTKGISTWTDFPYEENSCGDKPSVPILEKAKEFKITNYYSFTGMVVDSSGNYTVKNLLKTVIKKGTPIIIGFDTDQKFGQALPREANGIYICKEYNAALKKGPHALLIVGYDDTLNAFKVVNSWGTGWGNDGYAFVSYNFFLDNDHPNYQAGLQGIFIAVDKAAKEKLFD